MNEKTKFLLHLFVCFIWMAVIFAFSHQANSGHITEAYLHEANVPIRKFGHFTEFGILALLYAGLFGRIRSLTDARARMLALIVAVLYAASDELHQAFVPGRSSSIVDIWIDAGGALMALLAVTMIRWIRQSR